MNKSALVKPRGNWTPFNLIKQEVRWYLTQESQIAAMAKVYFGCYAFLLFF